MPWSNFVKDTYFAPGMSSFTSATIPDMSQVDSEQEHWRANYVLNSILRTPFDAPFRQRVFQFFRRTHTAFHEYAAARRLTLAFLEHTDSYLTYLDAIDHWESFLAYSWQALACLAYGQKLYEPGDGSVPQRLNLLYNRSKHADKAIAAGQLVEQTPLCVWLTNDGLACTDATLTFPEMADILADMAKWAADFQDPLTMKEKLSS